MTIAFKNKEADATTSWATVYTCPASTTAIVLLAQAANSNGASNADVSLQWLDDSNSDKATYLANVITVPAKASLSLLSGKLVLEAGDALQVKASAAAAIQLTLSIMEKS